MKGVVLTEVALVTIVFLMLLTIFPDLALAVDAFLLSFAVFNFLFVIKYRESHDAHLVPNPKDVAVIFPVKDDPSIFHSIPYAKAQDYPGNYRVLVVDDSKDPDLRRKIDEFADERCKELRRTKQTGRKAGAINYALEYLRSSSPGFVVVLDSDHRMPKDFLSRAVALIEKR